MSTPFVVPTMADLPDALDASNPDSAVNRLWRMYNERRLVAAYPNNQTIQYNAKLVDFPCLRYRGGSQVSGNVPSTYDVVPVSTLAGAVVDAGADVQSIQFWNGMLQDIYNLAASYYALVSEVEEGIDGQDYQNRFGPTLYGQVSFMFADAGIPGIERRNGEDINTIAGYGNFYAAGDIIGPWVFRDIALLLSLLKYRFILPTKLRGDLNRVQNIGGPLLTFDGLRQELEEQYTQNLQFSGALLEDYSADSYLYSIGSVVRVINNGFGNRYRGAALSGWRNPGYVPLPALGTVSMQLSVYGVADRNYELGSFSVPPEFDPAGPYPTVQEGQAIALASELPAPAALSVVQYIDLQQSIWPELPLVALHGLSDNGLDQSRGMRVAKPFLIGTAGYEFQGVAEA